MKRLLVLSSHVPDPRIIKRIKTLKKISKETHLIYWERDFGNGFSFSPIEDVSFDCIRTDSNPSLLQRFFQNNYLANETAKKINNLEPEIIYISGVEMLKIVNKIKWEKKPLIIIEIADIPANTHISKHPFLGKFLERYLTNLIKKNADYYVFTSLGFYEGYYKKEGLSENTIFIFENLPSKNVLQNLEINPEKVINKNKLTIGYIGAILYYPSVKTLFEACKGINDVEILIAGRGPDSEKVKDEAKNYSNIRIYGEYNYEKEIAKLYSMTDVIYSVYSTDNFNVRLLLPNRLYESIVCGKPIIVAANTYLENYVKKLGVGFSVPYKDVKALKKLIKELVTNKKLITDISNRCMKIRESYFYEKVENDFLNWIEDIYSRSKELK